MGSLPLAILIGCLNGLKWLLLGVALLLGILLVVQWARGDADARPLHILLAGAGFLLTGLGCGFAARRLLPQH